MAKKTGTPTRRERREERKREKEHAAAAARSAASMRNRWLVLIVLLSGGGAVVVHQLDLPLASMGLVLLVGVAAFLAVALGGLGASVRPRDRTRSGNIDFGN